MRIPNSLRIAAASVILAVASGFTSVAHSLIEPAAAPPALAEAFVQACSTHLDLTEAQRTGLRTYLEQEIEFMNVQAANHSAAEVAELIPAEREQLQRVAGHLMSPGQLRQFRELEATPQMKAYLKKMSLGD
jgi:formate dehydrogenase maturation protein FdhE